MVSHGRAKVIAGRSAFAEPFALFGEDISQLDDLFAEKLELLLRLRNEDRVTWTGRFRPPLQDAAPNPQPLCPLPIWVAVGGTPASTIGHAKRLVDLYRTAGHPDEQLTVGITSHFYVGETSEQALHDFYPYYHRYLSPETNGGRGWHVGRPTMTSLAARRGALMVGGLTQVAEKILNLHAELGVDRFLGQVDLGGIPRQMVRDSIQRFGDVVAPAVRHVLTREQEDQLA